MFETFHTTQCRDLSLNNLKVKKNYEMKIHYRIKKLPNASSNFLYFNTNKH